MPLGWSACIFGCSHAAAGATGLCHALPRLTGRLPLRLEAEEVVWRGVQLRTCCEPDEPLERQSSLVKASRCWTLPLDLEGCSAVVVVPMTDDSLDDAKTVACLESSHIFARCARRVVMKEARDVDRADLGRRVDEVVSVSEVAVVCHACQDVRTFEVRRETSWSRPEEEDMLPGLEVGDLVLGVEVALRDGLS